MKNMRTIIGLTLAVMLVAGLALADTYRLGANKVSFSPSATVTKTADYTLTSTDSLVKFTCSTANLTATLPLISDLSGTTKAYKILKTDSTKFAVIIAPASGDTIGGESYRYIIQKNAYVVLQSGPGRNWTVNYESPYLVEDHEAGTTTVLGSSYSVPVRWGGSGKAATNDYNIIGAGPGNYDAYVIVPDTGSLTSADFSSADAVVAGAAAAGNYYTFSITNLGQAGANAEAMLAATSANTTTTANASGNIAANAKWPFTLSSTGSALAVTSGDRIRVRAAINGTLTVTHPSVMLRFNKTQ